MFPHTFKVGETVRLNVPENVRLHGADATIVKLTSYGAHVRTVAAARGKFRALFEEMDRLTPELLAEGKGEDVDKLEPRATTTTAPTVTAAVGYTGDVCDICGSTRMKRVGTCLCCDECGSSTGC